MIMMASGAYAVVGNKATMREGGPAAVCRMLVTNENNNFHTMCSATLVAPNKILTAQHCIDKDIEIPGKLKFTVECGYESFTKGDLLAVKTGSGELVYIRGVHFKESANAFPFFLNRGRDTAIMILDKNLSSPPIKVVPEVSYKDANDCVVVGYGRTNNSTGGILFQGKLGPAGYFYGGLAFRSTIRSKGLANADIDMLTDEQEMVKKLFLSEKRFLTEEMAQAIGRPGDSGGPLLCRNATGETFIAGVASYIAMRGENTLRSAKDLVGIVSFNQIGAYYTVSPTTLKAIDQDIAPGEESGGYIGHDFTFPNEK
jgi:hypothetical protein